MVFGSKAAQSFAFWCRNKKVDFLKAKEIGGKQITRGISVLHQDYYGKLKYLPLVVRLNG